MANKAMWDWLDKVEGKKVGSSHEAMQKERVRQGYKRTDKKSALENKKVKNPFKGEEGKNFSKKQENLHGKDVNQ